MIINSEQIAILRYLKAANTVIPFPLPNIDGVNENTLQTNLNGLHDAGLIFISVGAVYIKPEGQDYLTSVLMEQEVYKEIDDYLDWLISHSGHSNMRIDSYSSIGAAAIKILKKYDLVSYRSNDERSSIIDITINGTKVKAFGGIENYIEAKEKEMAITSQIHIGHIINAPIDQSDFSIDALNLSIAPPNNTHPKQTIRKRIKSMLTWIAKNVWALIWGVVIGLSILFLWEKYIKTNIEPKSINSKSIKK